MEVFLGSIDKAVDILMLMGPCFSVCYRHFFNKILVDSENAMNVQNSRRHIVKLTHRMEYCCLSIPQYRVKKITSPLPIVLKNVWIPKKDFIFPILDTHTKKNLRFQYTWLKRFPWLVYSKKDDGAYC
ncbi:zinc finger MYM-type protein 1-like [Aphis craccivora]|uniref:Zinc finger MYM-type protein 1-like n=1 Tax=Aphis craccivora TaxID=307492 RepID=A0A6G0WGW7_APHCR|nr:zinc finger MYM-type protein 1-like [Aphis craccivora]